MQRKKISGVEKQDEFLNEKKAKINAEKEILYKKFDLPSGISIKNFHDYIFTRKKERGTKFGAWFERKNEDLSKGSEWLFKKSIGYVTYPLELDDNIICEMMAIRETYAGALYKILIPNNVSKVSLVIKDPDVPLVDTTVDKNLDIFVTFSTASKKIEHLKELGDVKNLKELMTTFNPQQIIKVFIVNVLLNDTDDKPENFGFVDSQFYKYDHGSSLYLNESGTDFENDYQLKQLYSVDFWKSKIKSFRINTEIFTADRIETVLGEIVNDTIEPIKTVITQYEKMFDFYREKYGKDTYRYIGEKSNTIGNLILNRLDAINNYIKDKHVIKLSF